MDVSKTSVSNFTKEDLYFQQSLRAFSLGYKLYHVTVKGIWKLLEWLFGKPRAKIHPSYVEIKLFQSLRFIPGLIVVAVWNVWNLNTREEILHPHSNASQERGKEARLTTVVMQAKVGLYFRAGRDNTKPFTQGGQLLRRAYIKGHTAGLCRPCRPVTAHLHLKGTGKPFTRFTALFLLCVLDEVT